MKNTILRKGIVVGMVLALFTVQFVLISEKVSADESDGSGNTLITTHYNYSSHLYEVVEVDSSGGIVWSYSTGTNPMDAERLDNGNTLIADTYWNRVIEVNSSGGIVWSYSTGLYYPYDAERLDNGNTLIADMRNLRVIEVDSSGSIVWSYSTANPYDAERLDNGNTLIADYSNRILEVDSSGGIVWSYSTGLKAPYDAERLDNGNTLIADLGNWRVIEVDSSEGIVWSYSTGLYYPYDAERLDNGNTLIAEYSSSLCRVIEIDSSGGIVWEKTVNSNQLYDAEKLELSNQPPVADANGPYIADEDTPLTFDASGSSDPDGDELQYRWDFNNDTTWDTNYSIDPAAIHTYDDDYSGGVVVEVYDGAETNEDTATVTINNVAPTASIDNVVTPYSGFILPYDELEFYGNFSDPGTADTFSSEWDFDDGTIVGDTLIPTHEYTEPGVYIVMFNVTDDDGGIGTASVEIVVESPAEATEDIIEDVEDMELPGGIENSLVSKLENAIDSMDKDHDNAAANKLEAFINQVEAQRGKKLTDEEADALIAAAQWTIDNIT